MMLQVRTTFPLAITPPRWRQVEKRIIELVEKIVEIPQITVQECIVEVPQIEIREMRKQVPKKEPEPGCWAG